MNSGDPVKYMRLSKEYLEEKLEKVTHKSSKKKEEKKQKSMIFKLFSSISKYF